MSDSVSAPTAGAAVPRAFESAARPVARTRFFVGMSAALLIVVLAGFARTFYLRAWFDVPPIPRSAWLHGALMTAWFVGAMLQTVWVAKHRVHWHRQSGWALAVLAVAIVWTALALALAGVGDMERRVPVLLSRGIPLDRIVQMVATVFWAATSTAFIFAVLVVCAVLFRRTPETHKRLMLLASVSIVQPAIARMFIYWPMFGDFAVQRAPLLATAAASLLLLPLFLHDLATRRSIHPATLYGSVFVIGVKLFGMFFLARTEIGQSMVSIP